MENDPIINTVEAAGIIGRPPATLRYWRHHGTGPKCRRIGQRAVGYRLSDVLRWLESQEVIVPGPEEVA